MFHACPGLLATLLGAAGISVTAPIGHGGLLALRVTTPGTRQAVVVSCVTARETSVVARGFSRPGADAADGWIYVRGYDPTGHLCLDGGNGASATYHWRAEAGYTSALWVTRSPTNPLQLSAIAYRTVATPVPPPGPVRTHTTTVVVGSYGDLPPRGQALSHLSTIVLDLPGLSAWPRLQEALRAYVLNGGRLVLTPTGLAGIATNDALATYLPRDATGRLAEQAGAAPDMSWRLVGGGSVVLLAGPPPGDTGFWERVCLNTGLGQRHPSYPSSPRTTGMLRWMLDDHYQRPISLLAAYLLLYLLAVVPWRRRGRPDRSWLTALLVPILFTAFAPVIMAVTARHRTVAFETTSLRAWAGSRYARVQTFVQVGATRREVVPLRLPAAAWPSGRRLLPGAVSEHSGEMSYHWPVSPATSNEVGLDRYDDLGGPVDLDVWIRSAHLSGAVTNGSKLTLRGACLVWHAWCVPLGDLPAGRRADLAHAAAPVTYASDEQLVALLAHESPQPAAQRLRPYPIPGPYEEETWYPPQPVLYAWVDGAADDLSTGNWACEAHRLRLLAVRARRPRSAVETSYVWSPAMALPAVPGKRGLWQVACTELSKHGSGVLEVTSHQAGTRVWLPGEQRWLLLPDQPITLGPWNGPGPVPRRVCLAPAGRFLNNGLLVLAAPGQLEPGRQWSVRRLP